MKTVDEFVNFVKDSVDFGSPEFDEDQVMDLVRPKLLELSANKNLIPQALVDELSTSLDGFQSENTYGALGLILYKDADFIVRAAFWLPKNKWKFHDAAVDRSLLLYDAPHDHDFSFITVGHYGPGYPSKMFVYDRNKVVGKPGETVDLEPVAFETLSIGTTFYYKAGYHIHLQLPPESLSISLNFILRKRGAQRFYDQFWFDIESGRINRPIENDTFRRAKTVTLAAALAGKSIATELDALAAGHSCRRTRLEAMRLLGSLIPERRLDVWKNAEIDEDLVIRSVASERAAAG